ncbi:MAG: hypothetical protein MRY64_05000 [Hyphomonadaceae bacterium]|nr:hypothetical protein [Hyphomonadaceae bacterium]
MAVRIFNLLVGLIALAYPLIALFLMRLLDPIWIVGVLIAALLLRSLTSWKHTPRSLLVASLVAVGLLWLTSMFNSDLALRLYPVFMSGAMLTMFAASLVYPPTMIERFARIMEPDLPEAGIQYTRHVTEIWCGFLFMNMLIALWTALCASFEIWALYNGFISYCLMGALLAGEFLVRRWIRST